MATLTSVLVGRDIVTSELFIANSNIRARPCNQHASHFSQNALEIRMSDTTYEMKECVWMMLARGPNPTSHSATSLERIGYFLPLFEPD